MSENQQTMLTPDCAANPLLKVWQTPFETPPFAEIAPEHFLPAFERAFADHSADRMCIELIDNSGLRGPDVGALEFVRGGICAFLQFRDLCLSFAQILEHFGAKILIELENLQLGLGDFAA